MKKLSYLFIFVITFLMTITVNAKYKEYKAGDMIMINDQSYLVIEDSNGSNSKLKVLDEGVYISNYSELVETCDYHSNTQDGPEGSDDEIGYIKCITETAKICTEDDDDCWPLYLPFETKELDYENNEELTYDENSETNIGYFFKNKLDAYYKNRMGLSNVKTRLLTADEHINYAKSIDMMYGGYMAIAYGNYQNFCNSPQHNQPAASPRKTLGSKVPDGTSMNGYNYILNTETWINSLNYTKGCYSVVYDVWEEEVYTTSYQSLSSISPLIEINKQELEYELTKEVEGNGSLKLEVTDERTYAIGDTVVINGQEYVVIGKNGHELKLISTLPIGVSNLDEMEECYDGFDQEGDDADYTEVVNCMIRKAKYCTPYVLRSDDKDLPDGNYCRPFALPYNYDEIKNEYYNPNKVNNVGHYIKNELTNELKKTFGNNITVDVLTYEQLEQLVDDGLIGKIIYRMFSGTTKKIADAGFNEMILENYSPIYFMYNNLLNSIINVNSQLNNDEFDRMLNDSIYPVITINDNDLPKYSRVGKQVKVTATPEEGYELVELKVTDDDNKTITYNPGQITRVGESHYTFTMPAADTNVYAKFVKYERYNVESRTTALVVEEGLNRAEGDIVEFSLTLEEDEYLDRIVYYNDENNEIEVPFEKTGNGYRLTMPANNVYIEAVVKTNSTTLYGLFGDDIEIPTPKGKAGNILTFTVTGDKKVESITFKKEDGSEIAPYYSVSNGVYSVVMPEEDVYVEVNYLADVVVPVPKTGDTINRTFIVLAISVIVAIGCGYILIKNNKRKSYN